MLRPVLLAASLLSSLAFANASGAIGYSGAPGTGSCNDCHTGGGAPTVNITGPASLPAGGTGSYSVTVTGGAGVGVNIALASTNTLGSLNPTSANLGLAFRELYQVSRRPSGEAFNFTLTAPPVAGPMTIYVTGNAVDGNGATSGDRSANTTRVVDIMMGSGALAPVIMTQAMPGTPSPLRTKTTDVTITAADDGGPTNLTYIWSATGPGAVTFTPNSSNSAAMSRASFSRAGNYMITCTVRDSLNNTAMSSFSITVEAVLTAIKMTPYAVKLATNATQAFTAVAVDQFEAPYMPTPTITYEVPAGGGTFMTNCINNCMSNLFRAQANSGGPFTVVARSMGIATASTVTVGTVNLPTANDTTAPTVSLVEPSSGTMLMTGTVFEAIAADPAPNPTGIAKVDFEIAEVPVATATSSPWRVTYMALPGLPGGRQPLVAHAYDLAGNNTKSSSVIVELPPAPNAGGTGTGGSGTGGAGGGSGTGGGRPPDGGCACATSGDESVAALGLALVAYAVSRRRRARPTLRA